MWHAAKIGLFGLFLLAGPCAARAQTSMTWLLPDFPPVSIPLAGRPTEGITDELIHFVVARWDLKQHHFKTANSKRIWSMLANGEQACSASALKTPERQKSMYFSRAHLLPPVQLVIRKDVLNALPRNAQGEVEMAKLIGNPKLRGVLIEGRSYGDEIDLQVRQRAADAKVRLSTPGDFGAGLVQMVSFERADYTIEYDFTAGYLIAKNRLTNLLTVPIAENRQFLVAGVACPRNKWGREKIAQIDRIIGTPEGALAMRKSLEKWMSADARARYAKELDAFYRARAVPTAPADY
jgi:uncharacterized protein (TIGR02285 family)